MRYSRPNKSTEHVKTMICGTSVTTSHCWYRLSFPPTAQVVSLSFSILNHITTLVFHDHCSFEGERAWLRLFKSR